ncbi:MAG: hypothetical protein II680_05910 [Clostridia bacterium]|nr:hypothetical protein [Clostridia bacterium]
MTDRNRHRVSLAEVIVIALLSILGAKALQIWTPSFLAKDAPSVSGPAAEPESAPVPGEEEIYRTLYEALAAGEREIVFDFDCADGIFGIYQKVLADHPELFWLPGGGSMTKKTSGYETTVFFAPDCPLSDGEILSRSAEMEERAREILARCAEGETLWDRLLILHDILADECDYDTETAALLLADSRIADDAVMQSSSAYGCLCSRKAVCSGYAAAFQLLASRLGAECRRVQGTELSAGAPHEWNIVRIGEDYVHVDVTWDDPIFTGGSEGGRSYDYFCITTGRSKRPTGSRSPNPFPPACRRNTGITAASGMNSKNTVSAKSRTLWPVSWKTARSGSI